MDTISAGEYFSGECPSGKANISVGDKLPNAEKAVVKVLKVDGSKYVLGPLRAGQILVNVPCEGMIQELTFEVKELPPEAAMNRYHPLGVDAVAYPYTLYLLILLIILTPVVTVLFFVFRKKKVKASRFQVPKKKKLRASL